MAITCSVKYFGNDYFNTGWHWSIAFVAIGIMFFVNFCIVEDEV